MVKGYFVYLAHLVERKTDNFDVIGSIPIVYFYVLSNFLSILIWSIARVVDGSSLQNWLAKAARWFESNMGLKYYSQR